MIANRFARYKLLLYSDCFFSFCCSKDQIETCDLLFALVVVDVAVARRQRGRRYKSYFDRDYFRQLTKSNKLSFILWPSEYL